MSFLLALLLVAMVILPVAGSGTQEAKRVFPENDTAGYLPVDVISIDPSIKDSTPYYQFLILSSEGKENQLKDLDLAIDFLYPGDPQKDVLKAGLKGRMQDIWDTYPVVLEITQGGNDYPTYGGSIVTVKFASPLQNIRLTAEENDVIRKSSSIINEAYSRKKQIESPYLPNSSPDSPGVRPTAPQSASIPAVLTIIALCCYSSGYAVIRMKRERSS